MNSRDLCYWMQGFFEISGAKSLTEEQTTMIKNHLNLVFKHEIDPSYGLTTTQSAEAQAIHDGTDTTKPWNYNDSEVRMRC